MANNLTRKEIRTLITYSGPYEHPVVDSVTTEYREYPVYDQNGKSYDSWLVCKIRKLLEKFKPDIF